MKPAKNDIEKSILQESVATWILTSFVEAVSQEKDLGDVSERLRVTVVEKRQLSEVALREALFGKLP